MKKKILGVLFAIFAAAVMSVTANAEYITEGDLEFDTETGMITRCDNNAEGEIVIPSEIGGVKVTGIGDEAFSDCRSITAVTIPDGVISIGENAFEQCRGMERVTIPDSVTAIGDYAFAMCKALNDIVLPDGVTSIGADAFYRSAYYDDENNWDYGMLYIGKYLVSANKDEIIGGYAIQQGTKLIADSTFASFEELTEVVIPHGMEFIGDNAFSRSGLESVSIPSSVKRIGAESFYGTYITSLIIPPGVEEIGDAAFASCQYLEGIIAVNKYYDSEDGVLFNEDKTVLVCYPAGKSGSEYEIPNGVTSVGKYAFYGCHLLESIGVPESVTNIGYSAFYHMGALDDVYYEASEDDAIYNLEIGKSNRSLTDARQHYGVPHIPPITVDVGFELENNVIFNVSVTEGSVRTVEKVKLYMAEYDSEGCVTNVYIGTNSGEANGEMIITVPLPSEDAYSYKYMLWDKSNAPLMKAITDISR